VHTCYHESEGLSSPYTSPTFQPEDGSYLV
jgi:hypothetical protein